MWLVVVISAGRNVLDSVPPTRCPPTHGRLCIYTSGSSRLPHSLCTFKSPSCVDLSAPFLSIASFSGECFSCSQTSTKTHTPGKKKKLAEHFAINNKNNVAASAYEAEAHRRVHKHQREHLQPHLIYLSFLLQRITQKNHFKFVCRHSRKFWKSSTNSQRQHRKKSLSDNSDGTTLCGWNALFPRPPPPFFCWTLLRRLEEHVTETSRALCDSSILFPPSVPTFSATDRDVLIITYNYNFCGRQICLCLLLPTPPAQ